MLFAAMTHLAEGLCNKGKGKVIPLYAMAALRVRGGIAPIHSQPRH
jgi:hypothetical protein